jgi:transcriptional regulator with PAS, ATPase and Fis domain
MSRPLTPTQLARLWQQSATPVVLLDEQRQVTWANPAMAAWLSQSVEQLLGQVWPFAGSSSVLAPDPSVTEGVIQLTAQPLPQQSNAFAQVVWIPLLDEVGAVTAMCGMVNPRANLTAETTWPSSINWHQYLQRQLAQPATPIAQQLVGNTPARRLARQLAQSATQHRQPLWIVGLQQSGRRALGRAIHEQQLGISAPLVVTSATGLSLEQLQARLTAWQFDANTPSGTLIIAEAEQIETEVLQFLIRSVAQNSLWRLICCSTESATTWCKHAIATELMVAAQANQIELPALRTIREDLPLIVQQIVEQLNTTSSKQIRGCQSIALEQLLSHEWPGELTELRDVLTTAHNAATTIEITVADLPSYLAQAVAARLYPQSSPQRIDLTQILAEYERTLLAQALATAKGNKTAAAASVNWSRAKFLRRCQELGLATTETSKSTSQPAAKPPQLVRSKRRKIPPTLPELAATDAEFIEDIPFIPDD